MKYFQVTVCIECLKILENIEVDNYEESTYLSDEKMPYLEVDLALHLGHLKPIISVCNECEEKFGLIKEGEENRYCSKILQ